MADAGASLDQVDGRLPTRLDRDEALVEALRQHEPAAAEHLVITYGNRAYRLAIRITGNRQDAEEVVQDAFWAVIRKIHPSGVRLLALVIATPLVALSAPVAMAQPATGAAVLPLTASPPVPRIVVDAPLAEPLSRGVVFIRYRTEDLLVVPVFGPKALEMSPAIGHLHMALDGATWGWGNTSGEPIIIFGLPAGPHKVEITLVSPDHPAPGSKRRRVRDPAAGRGSQGPLTTYVDDAPRQRIGLTTM